MTTSRHDPLPSARFRWFPRPFADELLYSVIVRFYILTQLPRTWTNTLEALTGSQQWEIRGAGLPMKIANIADRVPERHFLADPRATAFVHTALNYFTYFHSPIHRDEAADKLLANLSLGKLYHYVGLRGSQTISRNPLRYCQACARDDSAALGTSYWHLSHQLPGVFVCWKHGTQLLCGCLLCMQPGKSGVSNFLPPLRLCDLPGHKNELQAIPFEVKGETLHRLAIEARWMAQNSGGFPVNWHTVVRQALMDVGFRRAANLSPIKIAKALDDVYGVGLITWCRLARTGTTTCSHLTVGKLATERGYRLNSLTQLMLTLLAADSLQAMERRVSSLPNVGWDDETPPKQRRGPRKKNDDLEAIPPSAGERVIDRLREDLANARRTGVARFDWMLVEQLGQEIETLRNEFPDWLDEYVCRAETQRKESYREAAMQAFQTIPNPTPSLVHKAIGTKADWLRTHDAKWFDEHLGAVPRVRSDREYRGAHEREERLRFEDISIAGGIRLAAARLEKGSPALRRTQSLLMRFGNVPSKVRLEPEKWPTAGRALADCVETTEAFMDRRISESLKLLATTKDAIHLNDLNDLYQVPVKFKPTIRERLARECASYGLEFLS